MSNFMRPYCFYVNINGLVTRKKLADAGVFGSKFCSKLCPISIDITDTVFFA